MKGDFSRIDFDLDPNLDRILIQQGRVQLDADWNVQSEVLSLRHRQAIRDIIGTSAFPAADAGYGIYIRQGIAFDGVRDVFDVRPSIAGRIAGRFAIDAWLILSEGQGGTILSCPDHKSHLRLSVEDKKMRVDFSQSHTEGRRETYKAFRPLPLERRIHIAVVAEHRQISFFINGRLEQRFRLRTPLVMDMSWLVIGADGSGQGPDHLFKGTIERLRILKHGRVMPGKSYCRFDDVSELIADWSFSVDEAGMLADTGPHRYHAFARLKDAPRSTPIELWMSAGRCYVDGAVCELTSDVRYDQQPDCPGLPNITMSKHSGRYLAYLRSWDRIITAVEDPSLRESALDGTDTSLRSRVVAQVRLWPLAKEDDPVLPLPPTAGTMRVRRTKGVPLAANHLYRFEIHQSGYASLKSGRHSEANDGLFVAHFGTVSDMVLTISVFEPPDLEPAALSNRRAELVNPGTGALCSVLIDTVEPGEHGHVKLKVILPQQFPSLTKPEEWLLRPIATFKWSSDNGSTAFSIRAIKTNLLTLDAPDGDVGPLNINDWVEINDEITILRGIPGQIRQICGLANNGGDSLEIELNSPLSDPIARSTSDIAGQRAVLRRWEPLTDVDGMISGERLLGIGETTLVTGGISVDFDSGYFENGDYWTVPLREPLEWPCDQNGERYLSKAGPKIRTAELAEIRIHNSRLHIRDLRPVFLPQTSKVSVPNRENYGVENLKTKITEVSETDQAFSNLTNTMIIERDSDQIESANQLVIEAEIIAQTDIETVDELEAALATTTIVSEPPEPSPRPIQATVWRRHEVLLPFAGSIKSTMSQHGIHCIDNRGNHIVLEHTRAGMKWVHRANCPIRDFIDAAFLTLEGHPHLLVSDQAGSSLRSTFFRYDKDADTWEELPPLPTPRTGMAVAVGDDILIAAGGERPGKNRPLALVEAYRPSTGQWFIMPELPYAVRGASAVVVAERLYLFGGVVNTLFGLRHHVTADILIYAWGDGENSIIGSLKSARKNAQVVLMGNTIFIIGGDSDQDEICPVEIFDMRAMSINTLLQPPSRRRNCGVIVHDNNLLLLGGQIGAKPDATIDVFLGFTYETRQDMVN